MAQIDDFKANLIGGGYRTNQFRVTITPPAGIAIGLDVRRTSFLCKGTSLPDITIGTMELKYRGRSISIAGDRDTTGDWTTEFYMDTDMMILNALQRWNNGINDFDENTGVNSLSDYATDLTAEMLDRDGTVLKTYIFKNAWPVTVGAPPALDSAGGGSDMFSASKIQIETITSSGDYAMDPSKRIYIAKHDNVLDVIIRLPEVDASFDNQIFYVKNMNTNGTGSNPLKVKIHATNESNNIKFDYTYTGVQLNSNPSRCWGSVPTTKCSNGLLPSISPKTGKSICTPTYPARTAKNDSTTKGKVIVQALS